MGTDQGLSARLAISQRPLPWSDVADYVRALRALLRGEAVEWDGALIPMGHPPGFGHARPIEAPVVIAAQRPKGLAVARECGDGIITIGAKGGFSWVAKLLWGAEHESEEDARSDRVLAAAGHGAAVFITLPTMVGVGAKWTHSRAATSGGAEPNAFLSELTTLRSTPTTWSESVNWTRG